MGESLTRTYAASHGLASKYTRCNMPPRDMSHTLQPAVATSRTGIGMKMELLLQPGLVSTLAHWPAYAPAPQVLVHVR